MTSTPLTALLTTLRQALGRSPSSPPPPLPALPPHLIRPRLDPETSFADRARAAGAEVIDLRPAPATPADTSPAPTLTGTLAALTADAPNVRDLRMPSRHLPSPATSATGSTPDPVAAIFALDATIVVADLAIAASGTVAFAHPDLDHLDHLALMAAPLVIAIVHAERIVPTLADALATLPPPPATRVLVTGPSKTADIEGILVTGVHGPKRLVLVLVG